VLENRVLKIMFERKRKEVTGTWIYLHNAVLNTFCPLLNIVRVIKSRKMCWVEHVACIGRYVYKILVRKPEGKRPLGIPKSRWKDNIKIDLK